MDVGLSSVDPSFNRSVYLQDTQMKHGNGTVMIDDRGTDKFWKPVINVTLSVVVPPGE